MSDDSTEMVTPTGVTADLVQLDQIFDEGRVKRNEILDKLAPVIQGLTINTQNARQTEVEMQVINTYLGIIKDNEASVHKRVSSKLKQVEADTSSKHSAAVTELLEKITLGSIRLNTPADPRTPAERDALIEQAFADNHLDPVRDTELKTDPKDV
jgi:hypothetical protein